MEYIVDSKRGINHKENQDNYLILSEERYDLYIIFDGIGSANDAKAATEISKAYVQENHRKYLIGNVQIAKLMYALNKYLCGSLLSEPFTTYCLLVNFKLSSESFVSWLGDSRLYSVTNQFIDQITKDDSAPKRNVTKYLGLNSLSLEDFREVKLERSKENFLLCTDGFYPFLERSRYDFFSIFMENNLKSLRNKINLIIDEKNSDDATYIFIKINDDV